MRGRIFICFIFAAFNTALKSQQLISLDTLYKFEIRKIVSVIIMKGKRKPRNSRNMGNFQNRPQWDTSSSIVSFYHSNIYNPWTRLLTNYPANACSAFPRGGYGVNTQTMNCNGFGFHQNPMFAPTQSTEYVPRRSRSQYNPYYYSNSYSHYLQNSNQRKCSSTAGIKGNTQGDRLDRFLNEIRVEKVTPYGECIKNEGGKKDGIFKIVNYNVLSQELLMMYRDSLYNKSEDRVLEWSYRKKALMNEIESYDADILNLQEVEEGKLESFYNKQLEKMGYNGIYKKRTNDKNDGCAIYYRNSLFELIEVQEVEFYRRDVMILNRDNVAIVVKLALKSDLTKELIVANTHLLFNPKRHDIKLAQMQILLAEIEKMAFSCIDQDKNPKYKPVVLSGDFNLRPLTGVHKYLSDGIFEYNGKSSKQLKDGNQHPVLGKELLPQHLGITDDSQYHEEIGVRESNKCEPIVKNKDGTEEEGCLMEDCDGSRFGTGVLKHYLKLKSVYPTNKGNKEYATTYQGKWCNVDYIFYGSGENENLKLVSFIDLPSLSEASELSLPNEKLPSDHFSLIATFHLS